MLGEFEYMILAAAAALGDKAYGAAIRAEIESATGRSCSIGALYTTIDRLESKGLLQSWMGEATAERGGRAKRMVRVTMEGAIQSKAFYDSLRRISRRVSWASGREEASS